MAQSYSPAQTPLDSKVSKSEANYRPAENMMQSCGNCEAFIPNSGCTKVDGRVSSDGLCDLYEPMDTEEDRMKEIG